MNVEILTEGLAAIGMQAAVQPNQTPIIKGRESVAQIMVSPNFNGTIEIEGSDDGVAYTALVTVVGANQPNKMAKVAVRTYMRANMTAWTAGSASAYLVGAA